MSTWRRSSYSTGGSNGGTTCVEVASGKDFAAVRDSKSSETGMLAIPAAQGAPFWRVSVPERERNCSGPPESLSEPGRDDGFEVSTVKEPIPRPCGQIRQDHDSGQLVRMMRDEERY
ncbi:DUF397 domain-containing protein [Actinopolyspora sp. H202]|uniref:DUF397 domain-containing protein n=1 Tax=Actinopolyspora sp. H202 TaxID=1500456 RepID=UPI003EE6D9AB